MRSHGVVENIPVFCLVRKASRLIYRGVGKRGWKDGQHHRRRKRLNMPTYYGLYSEGNGNLLKDLK